MERCLKRALIPKVARIIRRSPTDVSQFLCRQIRFVTHLDSQFGLRDPGVVKPHNHLDQIAGLPGTTRIRPNQWQHSVTDADSSSYFRQKKPGITEVAGFLIAEPGHSRGLRDLVRKERLELSHQRYQNLNLARLPIPPLSQKLFPIIGLRPDFVPGYLPRQIQGACNQAPGIWGGRWGSNPRQQESQSCTLPTELRPP